jgi:hypothetical protein
MAGSASTDKRELSYPQGFAWSLAAAFTALARTAFLPSVGRKSGGLLDMSDFDIGTSKFPFAIFKHVPSS